MFVDATLRAGRVCQGSRLRGGLRLVVVAKRFWCDGESGGLGFNINDLCVSMAGRLGGCGRSVSVAVLAGQLLVSVVCGRRGPRRQSTF
jgi:hypothetical protein